MPYADTAADTLLVERARHGLLLTGHYTFLGVNHPGPFFLLARYAGERMLGRFFDGPLAPHLIGTMAVSAAFLAAIAVTVSHLAGSGRAGTVAATLAVGMFLLQDAGFSWLVSLFIPGLVVLPMLALLAAGLTAMRGSAAGLLIATVSAAVIVHAYIPLAPIAAAVWLAAAAVGHHRRRLAGVGGFPRRAVVLSAAILAVFAAPILLDVLVDPPGNIVRIAIAALHADTYRPPIPSRMSTTRYLAAGLLTLRPILWVPVAAGVAIAVRTGRLRGQWADAAMLALLVVGMTAVEYLAAPATFRPYSGHFLVALPLLGALLGAAALSVGLGRTAGASLASLAATALMVAALPMDPLEDTRVLNPAITAVADAIAARTPPGVPAALTAGAGQRRGLVAATMLALERRGIAACYEDQALAYYFTPERICTPGTSSRASRFAIVAPIPCPPPTLTIIDGQARNTFAPLPEPLRGWARTLFGRRSIYLEKPPWTPPPGCGPPAGDGNVIQRFCLLGEECGVVRLLATASR